MSLKEEILRIKKIIHENESNINFEIQGDLDKLYGLEVLLKNKYDNIGHTNLVNYRNGILLDNSINVLNKNFEKNCKSGLNKYFFLDNDSIYLYDLFVNEDFRGMGYGKLILKKCEEVIQESGRPFCLLITDTNNYIARNLYEKNGYRKHLENDEKIFYYKEII